MIADGFRFYDSGDPAMAKYQDYYFTSQNENEELDQEEFGRISNLSGP